MQLVARLKWWIACSSSVFLWVAILGGSYLVKFNGDARVASARAAQVSSTNSGSTHQHVSQNQVKLPPTTVPTTKPLPASPTATAVPPTPTVVEEQPTPQPTLAPEVLAELEVETFNHPVVDLVNSSDVAQQGNLVANGGNVRAGPGMEYEVVAIVEAGTPIQPRGLVDGWYKVKLNDVTGWIKSSLVHIPATPTPVPTVAPTPPPQVVKAKPTPPKTSKPATAAPPIKSMSTNTAPIQPAWSINLQPGTLVRLPGVVAPQPMLIADAAAPFLRARARILQASGVDYLSRLDDAFRSVNFETDKPGVASESWHKAGRAFDVASSRVVGGGEGVAFIRDPANRKLYRVLLRCSRQDGSLGTWYTSRQAAGRRAGYYVDVTTILLSEGFQRIPPSGSVSEAWHYEYHPGLKWSTAMQQLYKLGTLRRLFPDIWR